MRRGSIFYHARREDHGEVHHRFADRRRCVDAVFDRDKLDTAVFKECIKGTKIYHLRAHAVYAVDHDTVYQAIRCISA